VDGLFAIGTHGLNIADVCWIPLLHNARGNGINSSSYPTLIGIELVCKDHPSCFFSAAKESIRRGGETLEEPPNKQGGHDGLVPQDVE
jgi:hypothetical protein